MGPSTNTEPEFLTLPSPHLVDAQLPLVLITLKQECYCPCAATSGADNATTKAKSSEKTELVASPIMPTAFSHFLQQVPEELQEVLREDSIGGHPVDAAIFLALLEQEAIVDNWRNRVHEALSSKQREAMIANDSFGRALNKLKYGAKATPCWTSMTELQQFLMNAEFSEVKKMPVENGPDFTSWTPRGNLGEPPTTQRRIELNLKDKFTFIIVGILVPYAMNIPYIVKHIDKPDRWTIWKRLVGKSRFSTLKNVARMLKRLIALLPTIIPPSEELIRELLEVMNVLKLTPNVIMSYWQILVDRQKVWHL